MLISSYYVKVHIKIDDELGKLRFKYYRKIRLDNK